ncbi:uncharacterized protein LOC143914412 [Arctopsyche grandis]|uniref:uncharacterized protein LOC143914412 n=1 Tax=Arctopsyche grandis TaxID=121162 RepID=UPI00406D8654
MDDQQYTRSFEDAFDDGDIQKAVREVIEEYHINDAVITMPSAEDFGKNYMGKLHRLEITSKEKELTLNLILKLAPSEPEMSSFVPIDQIFEREINVYTKILETFDAVQENIPEVYKFRHAKCYKVVNEDVKKLLILEDLSVKDFRLVHKGESLDFPHTKLVITNLARLHALSFVLKKRNMDELSRMSDYVKEHHFGGLFQSYIQYVADITLSLIKDDTEIDKFKEYSKNIVDKFFEKRSSNLAHPYNVICHGDCWSNNLLFKYKGSEPVELRIIDWQASIFASPATDIAHFFFCSTESSLRNRCYPDILDIYYTELESQLKRMNCDVNECYPRDIFMQHVQKVFPHGLTMAMIALPFILSDKAESTNTIDLIKHKKVKVDKKCEKRLMGVVSDFVKFELI